ncbi:MAG TPA: hypothetical protein ACQGQI_04955 [Xylella sp.]
MRGYSSLFWCTSFLWCGALALDGRKTWEVVFGTDACESADIREGADAMWMVRGVMTCAVFCPVMRRVMWSG